MGQADFARRGLRSTAHERVDRRGVVRSTKRSPPEIALFEAADAGGGDLRHFEGLEINQRRQKIWQPLSEHALARSWRTDHQQAVASRGGDGQSTLRLKLPTDLEQIERGG